MQSPSANSTKSCGGKARNEQVTASDTYPCQWRNGPSDRRKPVILNYLGDQEEANVRVGLPSFVANVSHLPGRVLDLLEIAAYVFAADRKIDRGRKDAVEYHAWSRPLEFHIRVRDDSFWNIREVKETLSKALQFMSGHSAVEFFFEGGYSTPPTSLFDRPEFSLCPSGPTPTVTLFSGGLDSLCGVTGCLAEPGRRLVLVSHQSQWGTTRTQKALSDALVKAHGSCRVSRYGFDCTLKGVRADEETQRTRSFLYSSIAFAIAHAQGADNFTIYENGITSLNLRRREDLANARASRTTHPQTIARISQLFSLIAERPFEIQMPFLYMTKREVIQRLKGLAPDLLSSSVSCSRTFQTAGVATHCGYCFQCVDRRLAAYAAGAEEFDHRGLYTHDIIEQPIEDREARTTVVDYVRQAVTLANATMDSFAEDYLSELSEIVGYLPGAVSEEDGVQAIWEMAKRHGNDVRIALERIRKSHEDLYRSIDSGSLLGIVSSREYLKPEVLRLTDAISRILGAAIPEMFAEVRPADEDDLNKKVGTLLITHNGNLRSEHPTKSFACARVVPDHMVLNTDLLIEAKYVRKSTTPAKANEGIAADLTKYPDSAHILFVVYDPEHAIASDEIFRKDIEAKGRNSVLILR